MPLGGTTLVLGAYGDNDWGRTSGAAHGLARPGHAWIEQRRLLPGSPSSAVRPSGMSSAACTRWALKPCCDQVRASFFAAGTPPRRRVAEGAPGPSKTRTMWSFDAERLSLRTLSSSDLPALQDLLEACGDFATLVEGRPFGPTSAREEFEGIPEGHARTDKFLFGAFPSAASGRMVAVLNSLQYYPTRDCWWIGLLVIRPEERGRGLGSALLAFFQEQAASQGFARLALGVVEENLAGLGFWKRHGFVRERTTEPRVLGLKTQRIHVLTKRVG